MWKDWLTFSRGERLGIGFLAAIIAVLAVMPIIRDLFSLYPQPISDPSLYAKVDSFMSTLTYSPPQGDNYFSLEREERLTHRHSEPELFLFDPNTITVIGLKSLGFSSAQANVIERYRSRGGRFRQPSDFARMYVVDSATYVRLEHYIDIKSQHELDIERVDDRPEKEQLAIKSFKPININTCDTLELLALRGIGRVYARRILSYRNLLGGFHSVDQLKEVYGMPDALIESIRDNLFVDPLAIHRVNLNMVSYHNLRDHPYLNDYQARAVIYYRETMGSIRSSNELIVNNLLDSLSLKRIMPYLEF